MGTYNILYAEVQCPRCGTRAEMAVELFFGFRNQSEYRIGDAYRWADRKAPQNGGRPDKGDLNGEGYTECPACQKDFFLTVEVRSDGIKDVRPNLDKKPYLA